MTTRLFPTEHYLLDTGPARMAAAPDDARLRPGEEAFLRDASVGQGYVSMDKRFVRGLLAEIDRLRPAPTPEDLLS